MINYLGWLIDTEKELLSKLKEKDQEIEIVKERAENKIIQQGMYQFVICNHSLSNSKKKDEISKFVLSDILYMLSQLSFFNFLLNRIISSYKEKCNYTNRINGTVSR